MKYILTLIVGALLGGAAVYFLLVGAPRAVKPPGELVRAPEASGDPPGTAVLSLDEQFFNTLLGSVFKDMGAPTFKLGALKGGSGATSDAGAQTFRASRPDGQTGADVRGLPAQGVRFAETGGVSFLEAQGGCQNQVVVAPEGSGVRTGVSLKDGRIVAPLAFTGSYGVLGQCLDFRGWAQANIALRFEQGEQTLYGQINVESVNLDGVSPIFGGLVTGFVQSAINQRVNPIVLMRGAQIALNIPVQATGGTLRAQAKEIRSEVKDGTLRLHVTYDFSGAGAAPPANGAPPPAATNTPPS